MAKGPQPKQSSPDVGKVNLGEALEIPSGPCPGFSRPPIVQGLVIAAAVLWIYWPVLHGDWLWDDNIDITDNPIIQGPTGLWSIWFEPGTQVDYYPIKASVQWFQWHLWGMDTLGYHLTNIVLHLLSALLVWRLLGKFGLPLAWLGGLIFALHPVQVESVAWIAELKNTLSLPPFLLAMCAWLDYEKHEKSKDYFLALGLFLVAMLCKPTMVMFPVVILLYCWWKRGRIGWNDVKASTPFFLVSLASGLLTIWLQHHNKLAPEVVLTPLGGFLSRLACAGLSLSFYFTKCFLPVELMPIYPQWTVNPPTLWQFLPWPVLGGMIWWLWTKRQVWGRHVLLGGGFFLLFLAPFLGFNAISYMDFTWVMDHFLYIPIIGLIGLVVAGLEQMGKQLPGSFHPYSISLATVVLAVLAFQSRSYAKIFVGEETLWTYGIQHDPDAYLAHHNLGKVLLNKHQLPEAMTQFEEALQLNPGYPETHNNLGLALQQTGHSPEAMEQYRQALQIYPHYVMAHYNLGVALFQIGRTSEAIEQYQQALQVNPDFAQAHNNLGNGFQMEARWGEAIEQYQEAVRIKPDFADAYYNLATALMKSGLVSEAIDPYRQALRINPDNARAHNNLGLALEQTGQLPEAMEQYRQAAQIKPDYALAHNNLGKILLQTGHLPEAIEQYDLALKIKPDYAEAHNNLGYALSQAGQMEKAMEQYKEALRIKPDFASARDNLVRLQALQKTIPAKK